MHNPTLPISTTRFVWYSILTVGIYPFYWGWRAWWVIGQAEDRRYNNVLRGVFLIFTAFSLFTKLAYMATANGRKQPAFNKPLVLAWIFGINQVVAALFANVRPLALLAATTVASVIIAIVAALPALQDYNHYVSRTKLPLQEPNQSWELFFLVIMITLGVTSAYFSFTYQV